MVQTSTIKPSTATIAAIDQTRKALAAERTAAVARKMARYETVKFILFNFNRGMSIKRMQEIWGEDLVEWALECGHVKQSRAA